MKYIVVADRYLSYYVQDPGAGWGRGTGGSIPKTT
jgi:hypothetical protein